MIEVDKPTTTGLSTDFDVSAELFNAVVRNSPDAIVVTDKLGTIRYVNPASESLFGRSNSFLQGKPFGFPIVCGETTEIEILQSGKAPAIAQMRVTTIEWQGQSGMLATLRDVSESIRLTNELKRSNKDLQEFASVISHDIRAPLRNLEMLTRWLSEDHAGDLNEEALDDVSLMRKTIARMTSMVEDLLSYCRVTESDKIARNVNLQDVLVDAIDELQEEIFNKDAQIVKDSLPSLDCNIVQMVTLFRHILSNAIAYSLDKPRIVVRAELQGNTHLIRISDNGIGIEEKYWDDIFLPFNHLHSKDTHKGSGIGLATCKKIVDMHHGKIWITSELGVGSVVHITLPAKNVQDSNASVV